VEVAKFTTAIKSVSSLQQCQVHVDHFFFTPKTLSTRNSHQLVKPSMASFSTMTTRPLTHHSLFDNSLLPKTLQWSPPRQFAWPHPLQLLPIPQDKITAERASFWHNWGDPHRIARGYWHTFENFQGCVKSWETCWDCCTHAQGDYFWRKRWKLGGTVRNFLLLVKFPKFLGSTSHVTLSKPIYIYEIHAVIIQVSCICYCVKL
jgi:hypothetical protein